MDRYTFGFLMACWAIVVSLACLAQACNVFPSVCSVVLSMAWIPLAPTGHFTKPLPKGETWKAIGVVAVAVGLLMFGAFSGATKASNQWFQSTALRPYIGLALWIGYMFAGHRVFRTGNRL